MKIVTKSFMRHLLKRRSLSVLQLLGIACGVAGVIGMALSAQSALSGFDKAIRLIRGKATHSLEKPAGPLDEALLGKIMTDRAVDFFAPVIDRRVHLSTGETIRLLGVDPFLDRDIRENFTASLSEGRTGNNRDIFLKFLQDGRAVYIDDGLAQQLKIGPGSELTTSEGKLAVIATFPNPSGEPLILMDIGHTQEFFHLPGKVDRVDLVINDEGSFRSRWAQGFRIESSVEKRRTMTALLQAFGLNLQALSLFALFVGVFLIYNTAMFAVVSRRKDAGILRSLGAGRHEIGAAFMTEILCFGITGGALGGLLGYLLSMVLTGLVGSAVSSLYFFLRPTPLPWSWWNLAAGIILGCGASILGSLSPIIELMRTEPVRALSGRTAYSGRKRKIRRMTIFGGLTMLGGALLLALSKYHVYIGFAGAFVFLSGASLLSGFFLIALTGPMKWSFSRLTGITGKLAVGNVRRNMGRTAVAIAAFMVALSMTIGLSAMIGSFRHSLMWWMDSQLRGEIYISAVHKIEIPQSFYDAVRTIPGIKGIDVYRNVEIRYEGKPAYVTSVIASVLQKFDRFGWLEGGNENWDPVKEGAVIISESFARRFRVNKGDRITIQGADGPATLYVAAVFYDYTTEHGLIMMDRSTYLTIFKDPTINSLGIFVDSGDPQGQRAVQEVKRLARAWNLPVNTREELHNNILRVFDNTFAVTRSMRILAIVVSFFGIAGALMTIFVERGREFGIYRALGFSTTQVAAMTVMEGLTIGIVSFFMSIGVGTATAFILIKVINLRSFNWTIFYYFECGPYLIAAATALLAGTAASLYPLWKVFRNYPHMQIREE